MSKENIRIPKSQHIKGLSHDETEVLLLCLSVSYPIQMTVCQGNPSTKFKNVYLDYA